MKIFSKNIHISNSKEAINVFGHNDEALNLIETEFPVKLTARGNSLTAAGSRETVLAVENVFNNLKRLHRDREQIHIETVKKIISLYKDSSGPNYVNELAGNDEAIPVPSRKRVIKPKTEGQRKYIEAIKNHDMVFGVGPAGTGKTYLAVAMAVSYLTSGKVDRIVLTRPAVDAGEKLGFLPGTLQEKVNPYLRPLYDAMYDMVDSEQFMELVQRDSIEVAPLAYMRGRTLSNCFIILDEAQNATPEQMKMFVTRLGFGSKAVITGDLTQVDLPREKKSGLIYILNILRDLKEIKIIYLTAMDAVRHNLVQKIILAFEKYEKKNI